ncbi:MAG: hypothetical protein KFH98_12220 [Gemmatimonadetes bacterium]|nr:hypothetical protein [Gemmatimonadota bacterium]
MRSLLIMLLLTAPFPALGQSPPAERARTSIYLEVLGNGGPYSFNIEREALPRAGLRLGFTAWTNDGQFIDTRLIMVPVMLNYRIGSGTSTLELGGGLLLGRQVEEEGGAQTTSGITNLTATIGYRRQPVRGGLVLRAGFTPFLSLNSSDVAYPDPGFTPSAGVSVGYAF